MLTSDFDYSLPQELIAQKPLPQRHQSKMMVLNRRNEEIIHSKFKALPRFLKKGDVLVLNNTRVIPAKAWGKTGRKEMEFLFLKESQEGLWEVLCRPAKRAKLGDIISFSAGFEGKIIEFGREGKRVIRFSSADVLKKLKKAGFAPLPPYIKRKGKNEKLRALDLERYQTVFSKKEGAIAAPTAGLHFTTKILEEIQSKGVEIVQITLDVGLATFQPVRIKRIENHRMLEENYFISRKAAQIINNAKKEDRSVVAVGTTSVRALESAYRDRKVRSGQASTELFIYPGYAFKVVDTLLTNFHLPKSTLLMLVAAFSGRDFIKKAYRKAISEKYRFYSYGDCMLVL
ncbi:MAG: tRNA preQ1(34) S-adenosylmethionine ribosyltransferase-isomerase QueA [Candidatus Aminicenantes bacterium]|nr:MAG: tRNA preQ1(34) S-adenosylmethionine ribosyltransferase-isomerase QueA [Candidatus Aminicenantes bacterium]